VIAVGYTFGNRVAAGSSSPNSPDIQQAHLQKRGFYKSTRQRHRLPFIPSRSYFAPIGAGASNMPYRSFSPTNYWRIRWVGFATIFISAISLASWV